VCNSHPGFIGIDGLRRTPANGVIQGFSLPNVVKASCLTAPLVLQDCDFSKEPPQCRLVTIRYRPGCAEIQLKHPNDLAPK